MIEEMTEITDSADYRFVPGDDGGVVITRCIAHSAQVRVPAVLGDRPVTALGDECFASTELGVFPMKVVNGELERVALPSGLVRIGRAAFRGCSRLVQVELPESLQEIDDLAFSCTSLGSIRLPDSCTRLSEIALRTGPESLTGAASPYLSKLDQVEVGARNPVYCMSGRVLCRRLETEEGGAPALEAILCPGKADDLRLTDEVATIAPTAFAGTYEVGTLSFCESLAFVGGCGLAAQVSCEAVEVELTHPLEGEGRLRLGMPDKHLQRRIFESTKDLPTFDLAKFLSAYDAAIAEETDQLRRAKLMVARLARPLHLQDAVRASFDYELRALFDTLCVQFGARNYWQGFDDMADAGLLDRDGIVRAIDVLTARADTTAASHLLQMKRTRFAQDGWDYGL